MGIGMKTVTKVLIKDLREAFPMGSDVFMQCAVNDLIDAYLDLIGNLIPLAENANEIVMRLKSENA